MTCLHRYRDVWPSGTHQEQGHPVLCRAEGDGAHTGDQAQAGGSYQVRESHPLLHTSPIRCQLVSTAIFILHDSLLSYMTLYYPT